MIVDRRIAQATARVVSGKVPSQALRGSPSYHPSEQDSSIKGNGEVDLKRVRDSWSMRLSLAMNQQM